jgi:hypothetical protein
VATISLTIFRLFICVAFGSRCSQRELAGLPSFLVYRWIILNQCDWQRSNGHVVIEAGDLCEGHISTVYPWKCAERPITPNKPRTAQQIWSYQCWFAACTQSTCQ